MAGCVVTSAALVGAWDWSASELLAHIGLGNEITLGASASKSGKGFGTFFVQGSSMQWSGLLGRMRDDKPNLWCMRDDKPDDEDDGCYKCDVTLPHRGPVLFHPKHEVVAREYMILG